MNLPEINTSLFKRLRFILVETSRPGNIGGVAQTMKPWVGNCFLEIFMPSGSPDDGYRVYRKCAEN